MGKWLAVYFVRDRNHRTPTPSLNERAKSANMFLVISTSLNPNSRSRVLATRAQHLLTQAEVDSELIDLQQLELPNCDGATCYQHKDSLLMMEKVSKANGILLAVPIYNYQAGSAAKNLIELTGKAWENTTVGFLCAAGGPGSLMSVMSLANSLMLDFRSLIVPRFVYTSGSEISANDEIDSELEVRIEQLTNELVRITKALA